LERSNWRHALVLSQAVVTTERGSSVLDELRINWWMARRECGEPLEVITSEVDKWTPNEEDLPIGLGKAALLFDEEATRLILLEYKRVGREIPKNWPLVVAMRRSLHQFRRCVREPVRFPAPTNQRSVASFRSTITGHPRTNADVRRL
jgi:hypothetical protein